VAQVDVALEQQILDVPKAQREPHIHHYHQPVTSGEEWK
jgi:hypothetical protein